eukprot:s7572_g3.t4
MRFIIFFLANRPWAPQSFSKSVKGPEAQSSCVELSRAAAQMGKRAAPKEPASAKKKAKGEEPKAKAKAKDPPTPKAKGKAKAEPKAEAKAEAKAASDTGAPAAESVEGKPETTPMKENELEDSLAFMEEGEEEFPDICFEEEGDEEEMLLDDELLDLESEEDLDLEDDEEEGDSDQDDDAGEAAT